jgi:hypothetical protein
MAKTKTQRQIKKLKKRVAKLEKLVLLMFPDELVDKLASAKGQQPPPRQEPPPEPQPPRAESLGTIPRLESRVAEINERLKFLHWRHEGEAFPEEARDEWNALGRERAALEDSLNELKARQRVAEDIWTGGR